MSAFHEHGHEQAQGACCQNCAAKLEVHPEEAEKPWFFSWGIWKLLAAALLLLASIATSFTQAPPALSWGLSILSWILAGYKVFFQALKNIRHGDFFDENFLMVFASIAAFFLGEHREGAAVMVFFLIGETLQDGAVEKSRRSIRQALDIRPDSARRIGTRGLSIEETMVHPQDLLPGDLIRVRPGERVACDGVLLTELAQVDKSALTGESLPQELSAGDEIPSGSIVLGSTIDLKVLRLAQESSAARILKLIEEAQGRKAKTDRLISSFARWYTPLVVLAALVLCLGLIFIAGLSPAEGIHRALVLLVISCPCALVLSVPLAYFAGIGSLAQRGVLAKGASVFDILPNLHTIAFDKTGTLTQGEVRVIKEILAPGVELTELQEALATAVQSSNHPHALAAKSWLGPHIKALPHQESKEHPGRGLEVHSQGSRYLAGNMRLMEQGGIAYHGLVQDSSSLLLAQDNRFLGQILMGDSIRKGSPGGIDALRGLGLKHLALVSGDHEGTCKSVAQELKLDSYRSQCLPEDKLAYVEELMKEGRVAFVGDGINDGPVIARADLGVALGSRAQDIALDCADLVILKDDPKELALSIAHARRVRRVVIQNIVGALAIKFIFMVAGGFGLAAMWEAIIADVGLALLAILNSLRLMKVKEL